jgi:hypothetical protein
MKRSAVTVVKISFVRMGSAFQHVRSLPEIQETAAVLGRYRSQVFLVTLAVIACQVPLPYIVSAVAGLGKDGSDRWWIAARWQFRFSRRRACLDIVR